MADKPDDSASISRAVLTGTTRTLRFGRRFFSRLPSNPRCKLCASPFGGPGGAVMRRLGKSPWPMNPRYCSFCFKEMISQRAGAEIECTLLFADVRGSTTLAEGMPAAAFRALMNRFFERASDVLVAHDALVDKFIGDEIVAIFIPALASRHAMQAIDAARAVIRVAAKSDDHLPVGAGVHTGVAFVGTVGEGSHVEFTAMGDPVNITARLASAAGAGEVLVTLASAASAGFDTTGLDRRTLELKGKSEAIEVVVVDDGRPTIKA